MKWQSLIVLGVLAMGCSSPTNNELTIMTEITNPKTIASEDLYQT